MSAEVCAFLPSFIFVPNKAIGFGCGVAAPTYRTIQHFATCAMVECFLLGCARVNYFKKKSKHSQCQKYERGSIINGPL
jgi:hypothetical protein